MKITAYWYSSDGVIVNETKKLWAEEDALKDALKFAKEKLGLPSGYMKGFRTIIHMDFSHILLYKIVKKLDKQSPEMPVFVRLEKDDITYSPDTLSEVKEKIGALMPDLCERMTLLFAMFIIGADIDDVAMKEIAGILIDAPSMFVQSLSVY
ncbi:MAG: hypothetical protein COU81_01255 [Candidatus Portnoybacteria bacterium CG10_big_fil_rev_8_21_14_0_10_36_7]|uniref:Uncharacterized protein n=1 Tax=Candidatus Portnoybacteria bacterium CG10_big_fil_rev_8_21_14_0_10_36_7 TaxID=1974812 RepID=A0A2M8KEJ0_9BACT|nr:MAG: hypothetical protein COU81_01255 [Candidatus Portnoybacteria bacterium CG10_big_fil_rev_8_21_14_0_10_36_7]